MYNKDVGLRDGSAGAGDTPEPGPQKGLETVDTAESSAAHAHPSTDERPCGCNGGWVTIGQIAVDPETGEEVEEYALYLCRKCVEHTAWA